MFLKVAGTLVGYPVGRSAQVARVAAAGGDVVEQGAVRAENRAEDQMIRPQSTADLSPSERRLVDAFQQLWFGRVEYLGIRRGEAVLDPWPTTVRDVKFCAKGTPREVPDGEFLLKPQLAELFEYIRDVESGEIRTLEVQNGLPFSMEIEMAGGRRNG